MWKVKYHSKKVRKQAENLPLNVADALGFLMDEIKVLGPVRGNWPNYGKLSKTRHHCHLKKAILHMSLSGKKMANKLNL